MRASTSRITFVLRRDVRYSLFATSAKRERKGLSAGIKELDLKQSISDPTFLSNELIHSRLPDLAGPIGIGIDAVIFARSGAIQLHSEAHRLTVFWLS